MFVLTGGNSALDLKLLLFINRGFWGSEKFIVMQTTLYHKLQPTYFMLDLNCTLFSLFSLFDRLLFDGWKQRLVVLTNVFKDWSETKRTMLGVGHCMTISGHFFDNYINSFHKTEVLTVIWKDPTCRNLNWIKSYDINCNSFYFLLFSIL